VSRRYRIRTRPRRGDFFGVPSAGAQVVSPVGIPSAEAWGVPTVNDGIVRPTGIPSAEAWGVPTITPGAVTVSPTGIPTGESWGTPFVIIKFDLTKLKRVTRTTIGYELVLVARVMQPSGPPTFIDVDAILWEGLNHTEELSKVPSLQVSAPIPSLSEEVIQRLRDMRRLPSELWLYRDGTKVFAGQLMTWNTQNQTITMQASGALGYLRYWTIDSDQVFSAKDQFTIVKTLIDNWQNSSYGNFGINTANVGLSGITRDATYLQAENHNIAQRVEEMGQRENGFDLEVDPETRELKLWYPIQGVNRATGEESIVFDAFSITSNDVAASVAPGDVASDAMGATTGTADPIWATIADLEIRAQFGRVSVTGSFDGVVEAGTLNDHLQGLLNARKEALLVPGPNLRVVNDLPLSAYRVGDTVAYRLHERLAVEGSFRIRKRSVSVDHNNTQAVTLEFA